MNDDAIEPEELRSIMTQLGWSAEELARRLGVTSGTVRKWRCGLRPCAGPAAKLLRLWAQPSKGKPVAKVKA